MKKISKIFLYILLAALSSVTVMAANCYQYDSDQTNCELQTDCQWHEDPWGSWCEEKGCWNFWTQAECSNGTNSINKSCSWSSSSSGWCMDLDCWAFDGTNQSACVNNSYNIKCNWVATYDTSNNQYPCIGPPEKDCWSYNTSTACSNVVGCKWGMCMELSCWDYSNTDKATCEAQVGFNKKSCQWKTYSWGTECVEQGCWNYNNITACQANNCSWDGSCIELSCGSFNGKNESYCVNNTASLSCDWDNNGKWCNEKGCWNYDQSTCGSTSGCFWEIHEGGWCEEQGCWNWDSDATNCTNTSLHPGLNCVHDGNWCFENVSAKGCSDITIERDCMDTFYCWWNQTGTSGTCNDPQTGVIETEFVEWNPGCYLFDMDQTLCVNTTGCYWNSGQCDNNATILAINELNCTLINNQTTCNSIPALSTCCKWQGGNCVSDRFDQSCREQMQEPPEGAHYCEDYNVYTDKTLCEQIAVSPWFMPCKWDNSTERCEFKGDDIFTGGEKNIMKIDNEKNCEAAGGKWILDTYPSTNNESTAVRLSLGRCDYKFDEERNCNKECYACEYKTDKTNWSSTEKAKTACIESELGICGFTADSTATNGYGYCGPKDEFKKGLIGGDCNSDCGACTYMGDFTATAGRKPSDYCSASNAKCKWIADPAHPDDESYGRCSSMAEKTCEDRCDKCYEESICQSVGGKQGNSSAVAVCEWDDGICKYKSGASALEVCWDGTDNNGDNKIDCADSMCWSDPFCGGEFMFNSFGKDCFMFNTQIDCENEGCAWINENWGSWCDMPGAVCWKKDGTNQTYCEQNETCEWHSGFGGFCEQDWDMGGEANSCFGANNKTDCDALANQSCTWIVDSWCQDVGGMCDPDPSYTGAWYDCAQHDMDGNVTCESHSACNWYVDPWCQQQGSNAGFCDHMSFGCFQFNQTECIDSTNATYNHSLWCAWNSDPNSPEGGHCDSKMMSGGSGSCWEQNIEAGCTNTSGCTWMSGFCDPPGFGGEFMPGMPGGGGMGGGSSGDAMGGFGMQCFQYDGNQTGCENQTGCGWFSEPQPFCDVYWTTCPQYSYNETLCNQQPMCKWKPEGSGGFCDQKMTECWWNTTLSSNMTACDAHSLCFNNNGHCDPVCVSSAISDAAGCTGASTSCRWVDGWCNPAMAAEFFKGMDMGGPPTPLGSDANDTGISDEVDILSFGMKDMGAAYGFGITVNDPANSAACNDIKMSSGTGTGKNRTKFYWYLDTDGVTTNNCALNHNSSATGYEFYIKNEWTYDSSSGSVTDLPAAYRCSDGSWILAEIRITSERHLMCSLVGGAMVAIDKSELEKFPSLYTSGVDLRVAVASADTSANISTPTDTAEPGWVTPGSQDFELPDLYSYETDYTKKAKKEGSDKGFIDYGKDADCWTASGCADYKCKGHAYCVENSLGVEAAGYTDTRIPKVIGFIKETYPDSALFAYFTDKPANGSLLFYGNDNTCSQNALNSTIYDIGILSNNSRNYKLWHIAELYNDAGIESLDYSLTANTTYYYRLKVCDDSAKCGTSKCSNFTTPSSMTDCAFCKFVSRIKAPTGWNVYYDLDTDGVYEHWQGNILNNSKDGMFTNYTIGRKANILMNTTDGTAHLEFLNVTLTKTGMSPKIRDIEDMGALKEGTTTTSAGATIGYVGMIDETKDKIVNNLYPRICRIKIPGTGTCNALWHCDDNGENCVDRTSEATLINTTLTSCIWQIPYCEFSTWAGGEPGTPVTTTTTTSSSGGSSGGGGAISNATTTAGVTKAHYYDLIIAGETVTMDINKEEIAITKNEFILSKQLSKVTVTVRKIGNASEVPAGLENVYQHLEISLDKGAVEDVQQATLNFNVEKSWIDNNNINEVVLMRYNNGWQELATQFVSSDADYSYYTATTPGFSYFAVVGKSAEIPVEEPVIAPEPVVQEPVREELPTPIEAPTPAPPVQPREQPQVIGAAVAEVAKGKEARMLINGIIIALVIILIGVIGYTIAEKKF